MTELQITLGAMFAMFALFASIIIPIYLHQSRQLQKQMDGRFDQVDRRFGEMQKHMNDRFGEVNGRFDQVDRRFGEMQTHIDARFADMNAHTDARFGETQQMMNNRFGRIEDDIKIMNRDIGVFHGALLRLESEFRREPTETPA